jgi:hypothetical protein
MALLQESLNQTVIHLEQIRTESINPANASVLAALNEAQRKLQLWAEDLNEKDGALQILNQAYPKRLRDLEGTRSRIAVMIKEVLSRFRTTVERVRYVRPCERSIFVTLAFLSHLSLSLYLVLTICYIRGEQLPKL